MALLAAASQESSVKLAFGNLEASHAQFEALLESKVEFEASYGGRLEWDQKAERKSCKISEYRDGADILNRVEWDSYMEWFIDRQAHLRAAFAEIRNVLV